jgi:hypothetical protein
VLPSTLLLACHDYNHHYDDCYEQPTLEPTTMKLSISIGIASLLLLCRPATRPATAQTMGDKCYENQVKYSTDMGADGCIQLDFSYCVGEYGDPDCRDGCENKYFKGTMDTDYVYHKWLE